MKVFQYVVVYRPEKPSDSDKSEIVTSGFQLARNEQDAVLKIGRNSSVAARGDDANLEVLIRPF